MLLSDGGSIGVVLSDGSGDLEEGEADVRFRELVEAFDESTEEGWFRESKGDVWGGTDDFEEGLNVGKNPRSQSRGAKKRRTGLTHVEDLFERCFGADEALKELACRFIFL